MGSFTPTPQPVPGGISPQPGFQPPDNQPYPNYPVQPDQPPAYPVNPGYPPQPSTDPSYPPQPGFGPPPGMDPAYPPQPGKSMIIMITNLKQYLDIFISLLQNMNNTHM